MPSTLSAPHWALLFLGAAKQRQVFAASPGTIKNEYQLTYTLIAVDYDCTLKYHAMVFT
ncbi:hypothetical protein [Microvirga sp. KLBC 81]|uniref:hypothetical protein n=1 Tax=Microvirga sp. KLBC 81 TaxID=1862707 RepID=UPI0014027053|nr:hypothetical protein [Microvirga sp. KLBC 81]